MHDIIQLQGNIENEKKEKKTYWLRLCLRNRLAIYLVNSIR